MMADGMTSKERRRAVALAAARLERVRSRRETRLQGLRSFVHEQRGLLAIAAGLTAGIVVGSRSLRGWLRGGISALDPATAIARTPLGTVALGALLDRGHRAAPATTAAPRRD